MKKIVKYIMEIIFIFIIPLLLIIFNINIVKEYDENNNEIEKKLEFNESLYQDYANNQQYSNTLYVNQLFKSSDNNLENISTYGFDLNDELQRFFSFTNVVAKEINHYYYLYINFIPEEDNEGYFYIYTSNVNDYNVLVQVTNNSPVYQQIFNITIDNANEFVLNAYNLEPSLFHGKLYFQLLDLTEMFGQGYEPTTIQDLNLYYNTNQFIDYTEEPIIDIVYSNNIISSDYIINYSWYSRVFNVIFSSLNINNNIPLTIIIIYTLLWLVMWIIWHLLYLPLDFICSKLLFDRVDK